MKRRLILWVPLGLFMLFLGFVAAGLYAPAERTIPPWSSASPISIAAGPRAAPACQHFAPPGRPHVVTFRQLLPAVGWRRRNGGARRRGIPDHGIAVRERPKISPLSSPTMGTVPRHRRGLDRRVQMDWVAGGARTSSSPAPESSPPAYGAIPEADMPPHARTRPRESRSPLPPRLPPHAGEPLLIPRP